MSKRRNLVDSKPASEPEWRRRARQLFRQHLHMDLTDYIEPDSSLYEVFFALLPLCRECHRKGDRQALKGIYGFAEWCFQQEEQDLWNPAGVAFYEHLVDEPITRDALAEWVKPEVFAGVVGLFECRMEPEEFRALTEQYYWHHGIAPQLVEAQQALPPDDYVI
jgi:hypothetical protein